MQTMDEAQDKVLKILTDKMPDFYLVGGTALSKFYFHHRESYDLDFFTKEFDGGRVSGIVETIIKGANAGARLLNSSQKEGFAKFAMYLTTFPDGLELKLDFVEDHVTILKPFNLINGINVLSIEDIYLRKLFAVAGTVSRTDDSGRAISLGGRQEAKDFFDLYFLSTTFSPIAVFVKEHGNSQIKEGLVRWFRSYDRMNIKTGLLDIKTKTRIDYRVAEDHFNGEINKILETEIGEI